MIRRRLLFLLLLAAVPARAELSEEQKKNLIRKQHAASTASNPAPSPSKKKRGEGKAPSGGAKGSPKKKRSSGASPDRAHPAGTKKKRPPGISPARPGNPASPGHRATPSYQETQPHQGASGPAAAMPSPVIQSQASLPLPHGTIPSAPITIEKSGVEADQGLEPAPQPSRSPAGFWSRLFGSGKSYAYLSPSIRAAIDHAPVRKGRWKYIVVHNSGTREGNARVFDVYHRRIRHMQNGLAYHFVIGDGHGSGNGQIEIGERWTRQINGGHVASDYLNDIALGVCLVGDFNRDQPTKPQVDALEELVSYLRARVGRTQGRQAIVHAHKEINPRPTDCPGSRFPYGWLHAKFGSVR